MDHSHVTRPIRYTGGGIGGGGVQQVPLLRPEYSWMQYDEVSIRLGRVQHSETTYNLWRIFEQYGDISTIDLFESAGHRDGNARIKYSPPPMTPFWSSGTHVITAENDPSRQYIVSVDIERQRRSHLIRSPIRPHISYPPRMTLYASAIHFGVMVTPESLMVLRSVSPRAYRDTQLVIDLFRKRITATFTYEFLDPHNLTSSFNRVNKYMFQIPFSQLTMIRRVDNDENFSLIISLDSPPLFFRRLEETRGTHSDISSQWKAWDTWYRQTDIVLDPRSLQQQKVTLPKSQALIDIGRWTTYVFEFLRSENLDAVYKNIEEALQDHNIEISAGAQISSAPARPPIVWSLLTDAPRSENASADLQFLQGSVSETNLPFEVRYQLEVCISRGIINEYNISRQFVAKLAAIVSQDAMKARNILEYIAGQEKRIYDPLTIFEDQDALTFTAKTEIPHYCAYSRKATITPSTIYFSSPTVETTNRVLRHYARENREGRFLRVQFTDELEEGRINSSAETTQNDELFTRVYRTLFNGIQIGDRHYQFLAFGNSQFRENGAYFFCPTDHLSCQDIRNWMGNFSHIPVVAKYAARLGQCFSTTRAINGLSKPDIVKIADVENNGHTFTDGVGKLSPFLAQMIAAELGLRSNTAPSAFQFRLGGCKGILVVWPEAKEKEVHIRKSQQKFTATYNGLEIIRCARFSCATLNRQTITILSSLGVPDEVFVKMLTEQLENYQTAMSNDDVAVSLLLRYIDDNQMTINIATMIRNGFMAEKDPFVLSLLHLWRSWSIKLLKEKAKIIVENGAFVLGCVDETGTLRGYTDSNRTSSQGDRYTEEELPQIFLQVPDKNDLNRYNVIEGICLVGRNPSLHPGDLRVVQAVNIAALHHLRDVVVFPLRGDRDVPSMCSGGDLDGDDFFVIWDPALRPPEWNCPPMNYSAPKPREIKRPVQITDLMKFFVRFMKNDSLPTIAHAHLCQSDLTNAGVKGAECLELAKLHSKAVDYVKTGQAAEMPKILRPKKWPHFMEKNHKPQSQQYHSDKILGQLYDKVQMVDFVPQYEGPFDKRILKAYTLDGALLKTARQVKSKYDTAMKRLMAQQEIKTEFEIWSTFVLSRPRVGTDYKLQEEIARLSDALKDQFRAECILKAGSKEFAILGPFVAAMYKVTKEELDIALNECRSTRVVGGRSVPLRKMEPRYMPLISFPWIFEKELGRIATGTDTSEELEDMGLAALVLKEPGQSRKRGVGVAAEDDYITREDGVLIHRGEELDLFHQMSDSENDADESDFDESRLGRAWDDQRMTVGRTGEVVLATEFECPNAPRTDTDGGTGVEDVVPQMALDGLIGPPEVAMQVPNTDPAASELQFNKMHNSSSGESHPGILTPEDSPICSHVENKLRLTPNGAAEAESDSTEVEEEVIEIEVKESSLDKLARLVGGDA
ncbi:hypothetical protein QTJ16_000509 [Diplocarpon rosae]|uniref:RNA-dependent RNA polymerase n=1 Tax=Diplocarpon rosae TaxID=946125 RepID=A0AAD9WHN8_9HELO|nr:hypothetical protein QTJ16_000509 [Diplocarpon rosae]